jgi:hypothetical protein
VRTHLDSTILLLDDGDGFCVVLSKLIHIQVGIVLYLFNKQSCCNIPTCIHGVEEPASPEGSLT